MARKARQRISYVLELDHSSSGGHRLGVNGLAVDSSNNILYSGGRDGVICAWDLQLDPKADVTQSKSITSTRFRASTQAHTHWINDIVLAADNRALVSASSDLTVKVWRPLAGETSAQTIGQHADYVKCVAASNEGNWVASGGLDRKIYLWDLNGAGKSLEIDVSGEEMTEKGSVYALSVGRSILASGGPESVVRLWDTKSGKRITKFVGHTDNIRSVLVNEAGDTVMTASSDQTVKVWSVTAGRCMYTLTMHNDSVWSLFSTHPQLRVFYSSDRSGMVVKTDVRGTVDMDEGLSVAVAQEHTGVSKIVASPEYIWTASASSSINRWKNVETGPDAQLPEGYQLPRASGTDGPEQPALSNGDTKKEIPAKSILRMSNTAPFPPQIALAADTSTVDTGVNEGPDGIIDPHASLVEPIYLLPEETIEGQHGLVKHKLLSDRRRVLTLDTAGDVLLWDLVKCEVIQRFGKRHLEDVEPEVNTLEAVAPWCSIDTSSGDLTVVLEQYNCFDAEVYADELVLDDHAEFREDQRINLGRWILRYLFANLIDEEIKRDEAYRKELNEKVGKRRTTPPTSIQLPNSPGWESNGSSVTTPRANGNYPMTPGMQIGLATPGAVNHNHLPGVPEDATTPSSPFDRRSSTFSRPSADYFSSGISSIEPPKPVSTPAEKESETPKSPTDTKDKEKENGKSPSTPFGKKFRMGMSFGSKRLGRSSSSSTDKPTVVEEKKEDENKSESSSNHEKEFDDNFSGVVQKIHSEYEKQLAEWPDKDVETRITPSLPIDTPVLKLPSKTKVIIQEETSGSNAVLYQGTVESVGADANIIEQKAPPWLGEVLLLNAIPQKDPVKVSFVLHPWQDSLPPVSTADGNNRLNANRMLRVKKILAYVAERIDPSAEEPAEDALKPEEYLELYCNDQLLPNNMSLATLRAHIWKGGNDIVLYYKANGRKEIPKELPSASSSSTPPQEETPPPAAAPATTSASTSAAS